MKPAKSAQLVGASITSPLALHNSFEPRSVAYQPSPAVSIGPTGAIGSIATVRRATYSSLARSLIALADRAYPLIAPWVYRAWLIAMTIALGAALFWLQSLLGAVPAHPTSWQHAVQWAELIWLTPVPLAVALWLGWFVFAEVPRRPPSPEAAPWPWVTAPTPTQSSPTTPAHRRTKSHHTERMAQRPARLILRYVTRGENEEVLRASIDAAHRTMVAYAHAVGKAIAPYSIEVISERAISLPEPPAEARPEGVVQVIVVPEGYTTPAGSRFKARALTYAQSLAAPQPEDWYLYLDEESAITPGMLAGVYRFIARAERASQARKPARLIGQGAILYQGGAWFFRGADALRTADDLGRFRLQYALGAPLFGVHGSYILVRGDDDRRLSFDVGPRLSLTEDAAWALRAWARGYRFGWVDGYLCEQPPQRVYDFVGQRARWLTGIRNVISDSTVPWRYRLCLATFTVLWQVSFLPFLVAVAALFAHIAPFAWMRLPADFAWATFVLAYLQGAHVQATRHLRVAQGGIAPAAPLTFGQAARWLAARTMERVSAWAMTLCYIWFALLEAVSVLYSLAPSKGFFVIRKPSLTAPMSQSSDQSEELSVLTAATHQVAGASAG